MEINVNAVALINPVQLFTVEEFRRLIRAIDAPPGCDDRLWQRMLRSSIMRCVSRLRVKTRPRVSIKVANQMVDLATHAIAIYLVYRQQIVQAGFDQDVPEPFSPQLAACLSQFVHDQVFLGNLRATSEPLQVSSLFLPSDYVASPIEVDLSKYQEAGSAA